MRYLGSEAIACVWERLQGVEQRASTLATAWTSFLDQSSGVRWIWHLIFDPYLGVRLSVSIVSIQQSVRLVCRCPGRLARTSYTIQKRKSETVHAALDLHGQYGGRTLPPAPRLERSRLKKVG